MGFVVPPETIHQGSKAISHEHGEGEPQSFSEHDEASPLRCEQLLSKAAGGPRRFNGIVVLHGEALQYRRHAPALEVREGPAERRYRACKKIPVPLLLASTARCSSHA